MYIRLRNFVLGATAVGLALVGADPALAGQAGSNTGSSTTTTTRNWSINSGTVGVISSGSSTSTVTSGAVDSTRVTLSLQISDDGYHGYSPSNNIATFSGTGAMINSASIGVAGTSSGIVSSQQTLGNANVSVQANTLLDASALTNTFTNSNNTIPGGTAVMVLNPAFAISNSALAARVLAVEAMQGAITAAGGSTAVTAIDIVGNNTFEMSPEGNIATFLAATLKNDVVIGNATGITTSQQQIGNANVQTSFNTIVFSSGSGSTLPMP